MASELCVTTDESDATIMRQCSKLKCVSTYRESTTEIRWYSKEWPFTFALKKDSLCRIICVPNRMILSSEVPFNKTANHHWHVLYRMA